MPYFILYCPYGNEVNGYVYMQLQNIKAFIGLNWNMMLNSSGCELQ